MSVGHRMADRLQELLQQRALIKEHLEWLDAEIAASSGRSTANPLPPVPRATPSAAAAPASREFPVPTARPAVPPRGQTATIRAEPDDADVLIAKLAAEEKNQVRAPSKTGCWMVFAASLLLLVGGMFAAWYFFLR